MAKVTHWTFPEIVSEKKILELFKLEGIVPEKWSDDPDAKYEPHSHPYFKIIYVVKGSMTFVFTHENESFEVKEGDKLEILPGVVHHAIIGKEGIVCLEGHKDRDTES